MNNYRMSHFTWQEAQEHAARLRRANAKKVTVTETSNGWDVTWRQA